MYLYVRSFCAVRCLITICPYLLFYNYSTHVIKYSCYVCFLVLYVGFIFCVFCVFVLFWVLFLLLFIAVSFLLFYKFTVHCHLLEIQLQ
jgi:hypothetical protein